jgi:hypothetical protein
MSEKMNVKKNIYFICEQEGEVEREFKNSLLTILKENSQRVRAYLAQVKYAENDHEFNVALCLMTDGSDEAFLLHHAINIFKSMFGKQEHLDVIFLNKNEEHALRKIACPFFTSQDYQVNIPDFYLISTEGYGLNHPVACFKRRRLYGKHPDGYLFCDIYPALIGQSYGKGAEDIKQLIFTRRYQDSSLFPISEWPLSVHVAISLTASLEFSPHLHESDISLIAWGELYESKAAAIKDQPHQ